MPDPTEDQNATIEFLARGEAYGRPDAKVERIDTHISVVFMVGDRVYKLKRALRYPYLDYSTPGKREAMCRAELALNRRTAPELYLAVHAVTREPSGALALDGKGHAVDWLVEMKRFPQENLFDRLAERHELTAPAMRELADEIAAFHDAAEICDPGTYSGVMRDIATGNFRNLRAAKTLAQEKVEALQRATDAAFDRLKPLLDRRGDDGHIRRCHGDLHLRNICLVDGKPTLFDGIEFNDAFICIDTLYDLAFLLMDLDHRGLDDLASVVFNRYLDRGAETSGLAVLPLYLSVRAAVRAHVSIAALAQQHDDKAKRELAEAAPRYLDAAIKLLQPARPRLVALGGFSGSGKSTIAQRLAPGFAPVPGARVLRTDVIRKRLAGVAPETRLPPSAYDKAMNEKVYRAMYDEAAACLKAGFTAIADAAFLNQAERAEIAAVAATASVPFTGFWLDAPAETLRARVASRHGDASDADRRVLDRQIARGAGAIGWNKLDAGGAVAEIAAIARRIIDSEGAG